MIILFLFMLEENRSCFTLEFEFVWKGSNFQYCFYLLINRLLVEYLSIPTGSGH